MRERVAIYFRENPRFHAFPCAAIALLGCVAGCSGPRSDPVSKYSATLELGGDQQPEWRQELTAGAYLVEIRERNIDLRAVVDAGGKHSELRDRAPRHGVIYQVVSLQAPGELRVQLRSTDHATKLGQAEIRVARWRRTLGTAADERELGYLAYAAASEQDTLATKESWAHAADKLNEAISHFDNADDDGARAQAAYTLANLQYSARDDWAAAIRAAEIAGAAFDDADDSIGVQNAATTRAAAEIELAVTMEAGAQRAEQNSLFAAADKRLAEAAEFFTRQQLPLRAAYAVNMRGVRALSVGANDEAARLFTRALEMERANKDVAEESKSLANLAWVHRSRGQVAQAAKEYAALLPLIDPERQTYEYGVVLNNYGFCLIALGEFDRALALHTEALQVFTRLADDDERAAELAALGALYFRVGDTARALDTLRAAMIAQEKVSDTHGLASTLRVAGNAASSIGQHDLALEYLRRSAKIEVNPHDVARTRVLIANELRVVGDYRTAETELATAMASSNQLVRADALAERSRLRVAQRDFTAAIADLREADKSYKDMGLEFSRIDTSATLAQLLLAANDLRGASVAADEAVTIVRRLRANSANPEWRARFLSAQYSPFEARIAVDMARGAPGDIDAAWQGFRTADEVRGRSLADQMAYDARATHARIDIEGDELRSRLTAQQVRLEARVQRQDPDEATTQELRRDIEETRAQLDARRVRQGAIAAGEATLPAALRQVQDRLPHDTVVLAYFVGDSSSHAWLLSKNTLRHAALPGRARLQQAIDAAAESRPGSPGAAETERALGSLLLAGLIDGVTERRMLVIPDGPLNGVPFAALPVPGAPSDMILDRFVLGFAPSLALAMQATPVAPVHHTRVAVISDPVYAPDDRRLPALAGNLRGPRAASGNNLTRLPYSALEARAVLKTFGAVDTIELAGFDANIERVKQLPYAELGVLHFATHALARKDSPERSALFLSEYAPDGSLLPDSRLTTSDIMRSGLRADVVVLSGCATGDGSTLRGEGVLGLTYGFLANGAHSVVASLWPVEDASTARFMNEFYRAYRASGRAAEALRSAQLRTRSGAVAQVWSSFVVRANGFP